MTYKECLDYIRSDYYRITGRKNVGLFRMWSSTLLDRGFHFLFWLRLSNCNNFLLGGIWQNTLSNYWKSNTYIYTTPDENRLWI